jgi:uncharacterized C2H2 Zn-finger protein
VEEEKKIEVTESVFKRCPLCGTIWRHRDDFLNDSTLHLNGYQGNIKRLLNGREKRGLLLFTHRTGACGTTLAFDACDFKDK